MFHYFALALLATRTVAAYQQCYSSIDTSVSKGWQQYGSQSSCSESCSGYPYVALMNGGDCYCLSSLPSSSLQISSSQCSVGCNGWPSVMCGGTNAYTVFDNTVSGSSGTSGSGTTSAAQNTQTTSSKSSTSNTSTSSPTGTNTSPTTSQVTAGTGTSSTSEGHDSHIITSSIVTTTASDGSQSIQYKTITATTSGPTSSPTASATPTPSTDKKKSTNVAPIVGGVVGGVAAVAIALIVFFLVRRRNAREEDDEEDFFKKSPAGSTGGVARAKSNKFNSVFDMPMTNPFEHPSDEKRASTAHGGLTDPRLNPVMMGRRRLSEGSLADETDYSRKILGVANP